MINIKAIFTFAVGMVCSLALFGCSIVTAPQPHTFELNEPESEPIAPVAFVGDSITARYDLEKFYPNIYALKFGIEGDFLSSFIGRMDEVYTYEPAIIVILGGINDLALSSATPEAITTDYMLLFDDINQNLPKAKIVCLSSCPVSFALSQSFSGLLNDSIRELNELLASACKKADIVFVDLYSALADKDTLLLIDDYSNDGIHPNDAGYEAISKQVYPVLKELI